MKNYLLSLVFALSIASCTQESTTFILIRHAEKASDGTKNPPLTEEGVDRANRLVELLDSAEVSAIYSTNYKRTLKTVEPLATKKNINIELYDWNDPDEFLSRLIQEHQSETIVISGHSNTTPELGNLLIGTDELKQFDETDYGNILIITTTALGKGNLLHLRF